MSQFRRLSYLLSLNIAMIVGLVLVGITSRSLGVLAAGGDFIADSFAIIMGLMAVQLRDKHDQHKAPTYVALINTLLLSGISLFVMFEAAHRLLTQHPDIHGLPVLIISSISATVMVIGVIILGKGAGNEDLHMRSVLLDTIADGLSAAGVAVVGGIIFLAHGLYWLDSVAAIILGLIILLGAFKLLRDVVRSLRTSTTLIVDDD